MQHRIFIDLTNLITYAAHFDKISGVQRVEIELIKSIANVPSAIKTMNMFDGESARLIDRMMGLLPHEDLILPFLKREFAYCGLAANDEAPGFLKSIGKKISAAFKARAVKLGPGDIVFIPGGFGFADPVLKFYQRLVARKVRLIILIHDVFPITQPVLTAPGSAQFFEPAFHLPAEIITTSRFNAGDFLQAFETVTQRACSVVPHVIPLAHEFPGVSRNAQAGPPSRRLRDLAQGHAFILCVGTVEVRKNHRALLDAWRGLKEELGSALPLLVIAGRRGWKAEAALDLLDHAQEDHAPYVFIEGPSEDELKWLYASCSFSVLPSLFEGWGLPIGESLWFGKACAASNTSSIPDVGRDLCVYFDPNDPQEMKGAIRRLLDPAIRQAFEDKIRAADLRTWADVASDLKRLLLAMTDAPPGEAVIARSKAAKQSI